MKDLCFLTATLAVWSGILLSGCAAAAAAPEPATPVPCRGAWPELEDTQAWRALVAACRKEAEDGDARAQMMLAMLYDLGLGVSADPAESARWLRKAAEQGAPGAQTILGWTYQQGDGVTQNLDEAMKWFRKAAQQGHASAQHGLGVLYSDGRDVPPDDRVKAYALFEIAVAHGHGETYADAVRDRDILSRDITAAEIAEALELARACAEKDYKDCGF